MISTEALSGIDTFLAFIAVERQSPINSERWRRKASKAIESLAYFPHRCPIAPENAFRDYEIRAQIVDPCVFLFALTKKKAWCASLAVVMADSR
ncbi:hypothetical protein M4951_00910 [Blastopirellula sp. J2-11]|uniref:hypothetical protein n=1 Tax=Blastopirellula sp. J2-11 TaxID=2943192 RepID=UPI0021C8A5F5|nr:hypothetical protein [Blastopirellula sp. J2-11]UUO06888.1 hypothetical protein M4951_00910 [Blastopirellula sp. J2-11]